MNKIISALPLLGLALLLASCGKRDSSPPVPAGVSEPNASQLVPAEPSPTPTQVQVPAEDSPEWTESLAEWERALLVAEQTPRISLAPLIRELQGVRAKAVKSAVRPCMEASRDHRLNAMQIQIDRLISFLGKDEATAFLKGEEYEQASKNADTTAGMCS